ncbi:MAG: hypothetical protein JOZ75_11715 [Candidatus Dormibacteraeota bacterium]|nr:hypothetical protein [Candidatus Dormibacteraeota bacterium]
MATSGEHTNLTLRPRLMERGLYVWSRRASEVVIALGVVYLLASLFLDRKSQDILYMLATIAIVIAGRLIWPVFSRQSLAVTGDQLLIRTPLRRDRRVPLSAVTQVERVPLRSPVSRRLYGDMYVLLAGDATLTILSERRYRTDTLAALLRLLPAPTERPATSYWELFKLYKVKAPISARDIALLAGSYVLMAGGVVLLFLTLPQLGK